MTIKKQADETFGWGIGLEKEAEFEKAKAIMKISLVMSPTKRS
jgi:hypothetical protein